MRPTSLASAMCLISVLILFSAAVAEDLSREWLVGKWQGEISPLSGRPTPVEVQLKSDGTFEGGSTSPAAGFVPYLEGKWKIAGDTATFDYQIDARTPGGRLVSPVTWTLKRNGEYLEGTGLRRTDSGQFGVKIKKGK